MDSTFLLRWSLRGQHPIHKTRGLCGRQTTTDFRKHLDSGHGVIIKSRDGADQIVGTLIYVTEAKDFLYYFIYVLYLFIDVV